MIHVPSWSLRGVSAQCSITSRKLVSILTSNFSCFKVRRSDLLTRISPGRMMSLGSSDHHSNGSFSLYQGKMPLA